MTVGSGTARLGESRDESGLQASELRTGPEAAAGADGKPTHFCEHDG